MRGATRHEPLRLRVSVISEGATLSLPSALFSGTVSQKAKPALRRRKPVMVANVNGLLLAFQAMSAGVPLCPFIFINAVVEIKDFDFENLMRVLFFAR